MGVDLGQPSERPLVDQESPAATTADATRLPNRHRLQHWPDFVGVLWVIAAAVVALVPALLHGSYIGSYDTLSHYGLTTRPGVTVNNGVAGDQVNQIIPWITLAWMQVHQGHLPLWNGYEALGIPLAFNFGSGAFSLPALVGYVAPLRLVYLVQILVTFVVGGTGAYFLGRVLRLHPVACAFAGTTWVLSGPFFGYLGLPDVSVMSWAGWQFAAVVLIVRGSHRFLSILLLAVSLAFSILAGNPQIEVIILLPLGVFALVLLVSRTAALRGSGPIWRPIADLVIGCVAGGALAAPLALPALQLASASVRTVAPNAAANPVSQVLGTIFQSFWGLPLKGSFPNPQGLFPEQWVWVGAIAVALSIVAVAVRWRRAEVAGLAAAAVVAAAASVLQPVDSLLGKLPQIGHSWWFRSLIPLAFCLAMLAGVGLDAVLRESERRRAIRWAIGAFGAVAIVLGMVWLFGRGNLPGHAAYDREVSFVWPVLSTAVGLAAFGALAFLERPSAHRPWRARGFTRWVLGVMGALLVFQTVFLIVDDAPLPLSSSTPYQPTRAVIALKRAVGSSLVGLGNDSGTSGIGFDPDSNVPFGIHQFAAGDPISPLSWFDVWFHFNRSSSGFPLFYKFSPVIKSATVARRYGIAYVLEPSGARGPIGSVFARRVGDEGLYRIPGAAAATLVQARSPSGWPPTDESGRAVPVEWPNPSTARVVTTSSSAQILRLRVASVPGWHATIDGRPLAMSPYLSMMFQAYVPPGHHVIELTYWPKQFSEGLILAGLAVAGLAVAGVIAWRRSMKARSNDPLSGG